MLERCDVFVGIKLHSVILSYCANTPAIMVEYQPKCRDFMASIDMEQYNVRVDEFKSEITKKLVCEMYKNNESIRIKTNRNCLDYKTKLREASRSVVMLFNKL
jgi:polysaccharide pyruvyl transferase WcaK-like protein